MPLIPILYTSSTTATDDIAFKLTPKDTWFESLDVFVYDDDALMGDTAVQNIVIGAGDLYYLLHPVNLNDYFFRNATAGLNTRVVVAGILLSDVRKRQLGIPVS